MRQVSTSAPGKVMIAGEYVVLDGAPAICMAIDRRARVTIKAGDGDRHRISAPGLHEHEIAVNSIREVAASIPLLAAAWDALAPPENARLSIRIDTREFRLDGIKLGIGSSAAATVALVAAMAAAFESSSEVLQEALTVHRDLQAGAGSGADIACSFAGGLIEYHRDDPPSRDLEWPEDLHYALLWSGQSADTRSQIEKFAACGKGESATALHAAAERVAVAWQSQASTNILASMQDYARSLRSFDNEHGLGIFAAGHGEVARQAAAAGVIYKPCGAGAGDLGIAIAGDAEPLGRFVSGARETGFVPLELAIDPDGVLVEEGRQ
jgi:phosphomevalonate kinase